MEVQSMMLRTGSPGEVRQLRTVNLGLGIKERVQFTSDEIPWAPATTLLLYTDGVLEAANKKGEQFGAQRLAQAFLRAGGSPKDICSRIMSGVRAFSDGSEQADDISLVCVSLKG